jgi:hypothetical protein
MTVWEKFGPRTNWGCPWLNYVYLRVGTHYPLTHPLGFINPSPFSIFEKYSNFLNWIYLFWYFKELNVEFSSNLFLVWK